jgi:HK97 family phage portal protein
MPTSTMQDLQSRVIANTYGVQPAYKLFGNLEEKVEAYTTNAALYSIVNRIARTAAIAPFKVYKVKDQKKHLKYKQWTGENATPASIQRAMLIKDLVYEEDDKHRLNLLLERPNKWCRGTEFTINAIGFKLLSGNRFIRLVTLDLGANKGQPGELQILPSQFTTVVPDGTLYGVKGYRFQLGTSAEQIDVEEIIHSKYFNPEFDTFGSHLLGLSPLRAASKNLNRSEAGIDRSVAMLQNAGAAGILYNEDVDGYTPDQATALKQKVNEEILGTGNSNHIGVANGKLGFLKFGLSAVELEIVELEKYSWQQLCNIYGVPPGLFDPDKSGEHNAQEFKKEMITSAVLPELSSLRDDWNEIAQKFPDKGNIYIDYDISVYPELQEDMDKVAARLNQMWWFTGNEKRVLSGEDEDAEEPLMDTYMVPNNLTPMTQLTDNFNALMDQMNNQDNQPNPNEAGNTTDSGGESTVDETGK